MSVEAKLANLTPLPGDYLYPKDKAKAEAYDKLPSDEAKFKEGGKWWSMYDLMKYFHSGLLPEHSDANYFNFEIDFTSPHMKVAAVTDPNMVQELNSTMTTGLQTLASNVQNLISQLQVEANSAMVGLTTSALASKRGGSKGKKNRRGGEGGEVPPMALAAAPAPMAAAPAPMVSTADKIKNLLSAENLEVECLKDIYRVKLNTWDRIFVTNGKKNSLGLSDTLALTDVGALKTQVEAAIAASAAAAPALIGGARTRKMRRRRGAKKGKTHRRRGRSSP